MPIRVSDGEAHVLAVLRHAISVLDYENPDPSESPRAYERLIRLRAAHDLLAPVLEPKG